MIGRRNRTRQTLVAFALPLLLTVALPSEALLRCQMDGRLRLACCCPEDHAPPSSLPLFKAQACCAREVTVNERSAVEPGPRAAEDFVGVTVATLASAIPLPVEAAANHVLSRPSSQGPPQDRPSLVLLKHAFLI